MGEAPHDLAVALSGRYRLNRELGSGGMATVYLADDVKHDRQVALKVLKPELAATLGTERFLREIQTAARLRHPHILPLYDSGEAVGFLYYVMPYVEGESLRDRLTREKQLPIDDALQVARQVADALSHAHNHDVLHRDIKPENILLESGHAVVADFGIARAISSAGSVSLTETGLAIGTPEYMSPEQAAGARDLDGRSDVYSLGCVLYEMVAGQPPFTGPTTESIARQHLAAEPPNVSVIRPAVPGWVAAVIAHMLAKTPADRFRSGAALSEALAPRESTAALTSVAFPRRRIGWMVVTGGAALIVVLVGTLLLDRPRRPTSALPVPPPARSAIAVLPLQNLSADGPYSYFAGGLHEELLTQLSKVAALKVISRTSVMGFAGANTPLKQIATELGVGSVVEGTVQVVGDRLRVTVQLIDAATDGHLWAERYDRTLDDAFAIQSDVAQHIVAAVGAALSGDEQMRLAEAPTTNPEAYRLYLQGREYTNRAGRLRQDYETAEQLYERAVVLEPDFALAHVALAEIHSLMYILRYDPSERRLTRAAEEAETALRLTPDLPQAHTAMAWVYGVGRGDFQRAMDALMIGVKGLPNDARLWQRIGFTHRRLGRWNEALAAFERATELDPRAADLFVHQGTTYEVMHRYAEAIGAYDRALNLAPDVRSSAIWKGWGYVRWQGQLDTLRSVLSGAPQVETVGYFGAVAGQRAALLLWERDADGLLGDSVMTRGSLFQGEFIFLPSSLYAGWAHDLRHERAAARTAFGMAQVFLDSAVRELSDDWRVHAARGLALAGLGRRDDARREARWLQQSASYRQDGFYGFKLAEDRARILAQTGDTDAALDELERLLANPSWVSVHTLRLDPLWDPIRDHPRFRTLLEHK